MDFQRRSGPRKRTINTRHILFIVSGAFDKLTEQIKRRVQSGQIGFASAGHDRPADDTDLLRLAQSRDFIDYGMEPEFVGRLPVRVACRTLTAADLEKILLTSEGSILQQYRADFSGYGIDFEITSEAVQEIATQAYAERTGARGLMTVLERVLRSFKFELPSTAIKTFRIDRATIADPPATLQTLLRQNASQQRHVLKAEVAAFAARFQKDHGFELAFDETAIERLIELSLAADKTIRALCEEKFRDFHHGLKLIAGDGEPRRFAISREAVDAPDKVLSRWVVDRFKSAASSG
jgi:hypothetical protein